MRSCVGEWPYLDRLRLPNRDDLAARHNNEFFLVECWTRAPCVNWICSLTAQWLHASAGLVTCVFPRRLTV
jgi:hypothetical protein